MRAAIPASHITAAVIGTVRSARPWREPNGSRRARPTCCRCPISTSSSPSPNRSPPSPSRTSAWSTTSCSGPPPRRSRPSPADPRHLGAEIGFIAVLHTWGQTLQYHPDLHCVVPGGGLAPDGEGWIACRPGFFLPVRVLSSLFRRLFLEALDAAFRAGELSFHASLGELAEPARFAQLLNAARGVTWVVYAKPPFGGPEQVFEYLGRYTHRVAISNSQLVRIEDGSVAFR